MVTPHAGPVMLFIEKLSLLLIRFRCISRQPPPFSTLRMCPSEKLSLGGIFPPSLPPFLANEPPRPRQPVGPRAQWRKEIIGGGRVRPPHQTLFCRHEVRALSFRFMSMPNERTTPPSERAAGRARARTNHKSIEPAGSGNKSAVLSLPSSFPGAFFFLLRGGGNFHLNSAF